MTRHRPPAAARSPYITRQGWEALHAEQQILWQRRREVVKHLAAAAAEGDRSENAEYIYRKKQLREIDRRIRYLQKRLPALKVVEAQPQGTGQVFFGAWVTLEDEDGHRRRYRLVGPDEFDREPAYISIDAPMARALLKKQVDDEVEVPGKGGPGTYRVVDIEYAATDS
jgi:transcription elongation factor GreB